MIWLTSFFFPLQDPRNFPETLEVGRTTLESLALLESNRYKIPV